MMLMVMMMRTTATVMTTRIMMMMMQFPLLAALFLEAPDIVVDGRLTHPRKTCALSTMA